MVNKDIKRISNWLYDISFKHKNKYSVIDFRGEIKKTLLCK